MIANQNGDIIQPLNPADYFTLAMDDEIRRENMPGSLCGFALELDRHPDIDKLASRIDEFTHRFPLALASLQQHGKRFYWCTRQQPEPIFFQHHCPETENDESFQRSTINHILNLQEPREINGANRISFNFWPTN